MFLLHGLQLEDLTEDVETGAADGHIRISTETSFIGVQVTRATMNSNGDYQICKSKQFIFEKQVCELRFLFFAMFYDQGVLRGVLFLSGPYDSMPLAAALPRCARRVK
jgi:hypothetical protein